MEKAIFSITCTTCQARLVVRSEAAIGAILECPRCQSMVQVLPPPGWQPASLSAMAVAGQPGTSGPPPLDCVATGPLVLELEPAGASLLGKLLHAKWLLWGVAPLATLTAMMAVLWLLLPASKAEPVALETNRPAMAVASPAAKVELPTATTAKKDTAEQATASTELRSGQLPSEPTPTQPATPSLAQASRPRDAKPPELDPFPAVAAEDDETKPVEIKKSPPALVDVAARLADPIAGLELTDMPLLKAVDLLAAMGALPVTMDVDAMTELGVSPRDSVSLQLASTTLGKALEALAAQKGLALDVEGNQVFVGAPAAYRETLRTVRYTVSDLTGSDKIAVAELAALVRKLVAPESWQGNNGRGMIEADQGALVVAQTNAVHRQILVFCEKLRLARHKPLRSRENPERFILDTRRDQAGKMLDRPVTVNFHEPAPLASVLRFLAEASGSNILIDRAALAAAETSDRVEAALIANRQPLGPTLTRLLRPLGLTYRTLGADIIQVTTTEAADERLELEFYPVAAWLAKGIAGPALAERLKAHVAASTWSDVGGLGEVYFDPPSECLLVLQSQPAQVAIERLLRGGPREPLQGRGQKAESHHGDTEDTEKARHKTGLKPRINTDGRG